MEQLLLELLAPEPPRFDNFLPGGNAEVLAALRKCLGPRRPETVLYLWGPRGCGKSHLLQASVAAGVDALYLAGNALKEIPPPAELIAVDDVDDLSVESQQVLFSLINTQRAQGRLLIATGNGPPAELAIREEVRNRLGWGLVFGLKPLCDEELPMALVDYAGARGFRIPPEVIDHLLKFSRRDLGTLLWQLSLLDRQSLLEKKPVSLAMLRRLLRHQQSATTE